jgi:hypothetical protein
VGAAAQPPGVSSTSGAATRGRMTLGMGIFFTTEIIFHDKNDFQTSSFTAESSIT